MAGESNARTIMTMILAIVMLGFAVAFYALGSALYLLLTFIGIVLALMVASGIVSESSKKGK